MEATGGYSFEFVDPVPEDYNCPICLQVLRDPHLTSCCGHHLCETCLNRIKKSLRPKCPRCSKENFTTLLNKQLNNNITALKVRCNLKAYGCEWMGALENHPRHLNKDNIKGECRFYGAYCPLKCGRSLMFRYKIEQHLQTECPLRSFACKYCGYKDSYRKVQAHYSSCKQYPLDCPNKCGAATMKRCEIKSHLDKCPLQEVMCEFGFAGCTTRMKRNDLKNHMVKMTQVHLALVGRHSAKLQQTCSELQQTCSTLKRKCCDLEDSNSELKRKISRLENPRRWI